MKQGTDRKGTKYSKPFTFHTHTPLLRRVIIYLTSSPCVLGNTTPSTQVYTGTEGHNPQSCSKRPLPLHMTTLPASPQLARVTEVPGDQLTTNPVIQTKAAMITAARTTVRSSTNVTDNSTGRCDHHMILGYNMLRVNFNQMATLVQEDLPKSQVPRLNVQCEVQSSFQDLGFSQIFFKNNTKDENTTILS